MRSKQADKTDWADDGYTASRQRNRGENQDESQFLEKFYGSSYIDNLTVQEMEKDFEKGAQVFASAIKEGLIKDIPMDLFSNITFGLLHAFEKEFYKKKKLDTKLLEQSFKMYWGLLKK